MPVEITDYSLFEARPGVSVLLLPDTPVFTIVAASQDFIRTTGRHREEVIGKGLFEVFPQSPADPQFIARQRVSASFEHVLRHKQIHEVPQQRYDIVNSDGTFSERYWKTSSVPVVSGEGAVRYIIHTSEDVTAQVVSGQREEAFRDLEKAYRLYRQAPVAVCIVKGPDYIVELANEHMLDSLGRSANIIGKPIQDTLTEADQQGLIAILDRVRTTGTSFSVNRFPATLLVNGVREQRYFDLVLKPYFPHAGDKEPTNIFCVAHNVTQQVLDQKNKEESEHRFRTLIEEASVATGLYLGRELRIEYANDIMLGYWGKDRSVIGKTFSEGVPELKGQPFFGYLDAVYTTGVPYTGREEETWVEVEGKLQPFYFDFIYKALRNKEGNIYGVHHMAVDVTERVLNRKKVEEAREETERQKRLYEAINGSTPDLIYVFDLDYRFLYANPALLTMWGSTWEHSIGKGLLDNGYEPWHAEMHEREIDLVVATKKPVRGEVAFPHATLGRRVYDYIFVPVINDAGAVEAVAGTTRDITEQKLAEEALRLSEGRLQQKIEERTAELERTVEELRRSNASLEEFAYAASHDLKEPIRKIEFFTDRLRQQLQPQLADDQARLFDRVENSVLRMNALIDDLLSYSHISRGTPDLEPVDLGLTVKQVLEDLELKIQERGAQVTVGSLPVVTGNKRHLQQLFQNLLGNAVKYSRPGVTPQIEVSSRTVRGSDTPVALSEEEAGKSYHYIRIRDNGIGFAQEDAERIFKLFQRLHGRTEYEGTGVGLAIVQKVVDNMQGYIWAEGRPGEGATFHLLLPAQ